MARQKTENEKELRDFREKNILELFKDLENANQKQIYGLDMYLVAKRYIRTWEENEKVSSERLKHAFNIDLKPIKIEFEVIYWRKANAIHQWFVENVQKGVDDCGEYYVTFEQLQELLDLVNKVIENPEKALELLPTQKGFFFGGIEYDGCYFEDLKQTQRELKEVFKNKIKFEGMSFYYHSSW